MILSLEQAARRIGGCQSTNHRQCYGEPWQCEGCGKTVCCNEGTTDRPELCDDCWCEAQRNEEIAHHEPH